MQDSNAGPPSAAASSVGSVLTTFGRILAPLGVITAILFYFGYVRQRAFYQYYGLDLGTLGFSTTDFLVGSAQVAFLPLAATLIVGLFMIVAHHVLTFLLHNGTGAWRRAAFLTFAGLTVVMFALAVAGLADAPAFRTAYASLVPPVALCLGALFAAYTAYLAGRYLRVPAEVREGLDATRTLGLSMLTAVILVGVFWATSTFAEFRGTVAAHAAEMALPIEPQAVIYSKQKLYITGPGIRLDSLERSDAAYVYRYSGLRLLVHTNGHWFLLPSGWSRASESTVVILPDTSGDIRISLAP